MPRSYHLLRGWCESEACMCVCCLYPLCYLLLLCFDVAFFHVLFTVLTRPCFRSQQFQTIFFLHPFLCVVCCLHSCGSSSVIKRAGEWSGSVSFDWKFCAMTTTFIVQFSGCSLLKKRWREAKTTKQPRFPNHSRQVSTINVLTSMSAAACNCNSLSAKRQFCGIFYSISRRFQ